MAFASASASASAGGGADGQAAIAAITAAARRAGAAHVEVHDALGSTQDRAREWARAAAQGGGLGGGLPAVVLARTQTAGRGRGGRAWASPPGGVWLSAVVRGAGAPPAPPPLLPLTIPAALAAARALEAAAPGLGVRLKWPNDLYAGSGATGWRKLGGILCDVEGPFAVIGIGLDVDVPAEGFPDDLRPGATSVLGELGWAPPLERVVEEVLARLFPAALAWAAADQPARAAWVEEAWARSLLRSVASFRVEPPTGEPFAARALGLDGDGALRVERVERVERAEPVADGRVERLVSAHLVL